MEPARNRSDSLTPSQQRAVEARGNVLVMAGAGTGKTKTLIARCLDCLERERVALDELLIVTFTEAAAAEMRLRLRKSLEEKIAAQPDNAGWQEQMARFDLAHIGTLHSFCFKLIREHFYELGLDPQPAILDEGEARQLANETLQEQLQSHYEGEDDFSLAVQNLIQIHGGGRDEKIRALILRLQQYSQSRPDAAGWLARQVQNFSTTEPTDWRRWLLCAIADWRDEWLPVLENLKSGNEKAVELAGIFSRLGGVGVAPDNNISREIATAVLEQIISADGNWPAKRKGVLREPLEDLFDEAKFLLSLAAVKNGGDPLAEDWAWIRGQMQTLLRLAQEFAEKFAGRKHADGVLDFHDLEQFALKLLWDFSADKPSSVAETWRAKLKFVFVDEYQDINAAQDKIISALSRDGADANRFLVGDVKQSIYRFRLANPKIFRDYAKSWRDKNAQTIPLSENFRSRESLLNFVNSLFAPLMREEIGGVDYDDEAKLKFGKRWGETPADPNQNEGHSPATACGDARPTNSEPRAELLLRLKPGRDDEPVDGELADLVEADKEARLVAGRLKKLAADRHEIWDGDKKVFRAAEWRDMAVLLRSPSGKAEIFAKEFERAGVPLVVERGGFYDTSEILDLLSLLQLLDNPLQDVPCIAVLRSPLAGLSLDDLAEIRLAAKDVHFWTALNRVQNEKSKIGNALADKTRKFLERFSRWRKLAKQVSLSQCLEEMLAETLYADWLRAQPRGAQRAANVGRFLQLAQQFDQFQRQGLFRFLKFIEAQRETEVEPEIPAAAAGNAVRLMSIHQSKGLEFPVVAVADLAKQFNEQDLRDEIIFDEEFGLCPKVKPPSNGRRYPSLTHWLARRRQKRDLRGEELRLLYVAMTRARDTLILTASITEKNWDEKWAQLQPVTTQKIAGAKSFADWLATWFGARCASGETQGDFPELRWRIADDAELADEDKTENGKRKAESELPALDTATVEKLQAVLAWEYPFDAATRRKAKSSVTELRRAAEELDEEAEPFFVRPSFTTKKRKTESGKPRLSAGEAGTAHHKFLHHVALENAGGMAELETEARRLEREKILTADERAVLDLNALADFWNSQPGTKIRAQPQEAVKRELPFTAKFSPAEITKIKGERIEAGLENEFVVVQGIADLVVLLPEEIWLVDFKTDRVGAGELAEKAKIYAPQMELYARALAKIYSRPVTNRWLHFLDARKTVDVKT